MSSNLTMMSGPVLKAPKFAATGTVQGLKDAGPGPGKPVIVDWSQIQNKPTLGAQFQQLQLIEAPDDGAYIVGVMLIAGVPTGIRIAYPSAKTIAEAVIAAEEAVAAAASASASAVSANNSKLEAAASAAAAQLSEDAAAGSASDAAASATEAAASATQAAETIAALALPGQVPVGGYTATEFQSILDNAVVMQSYTPLRAYTGDRAACIRLTAPGISGFFVPVPGDTTTLDDGCMNIRDGADRLWHRLGSVNYQVQAAWAGVIANTGTDMTANCRTALAAAKGREVVFPAGRIDVWGPLVTRETTYETRISGCGPAYFIDDPRFYNGMDQYGGTDFAEGYPPDDLLKSSTVFVCNGCALLGEPDTPTEERWVDTPRSLWGVVLWAKKTPGGVYPQMAWHVASENFFVAECTLTQFRMFGRAWRNGAAREKRVGDYDGGWGQGPVGTPNTFPWSWYTGTALLVNSDRNPQQYGSLVPGHRTVLLELEEISSSPRNWLVVNGDGFKSSVIIGATSGRMVGAATYSGNLQVLCAISTISPHFENYANHGFVAGDNAPHALWRYDATTQVFGGYVTNMNGAPDPIVDTGSGHQSIPIWGSSDFQLGRELRNLPPAGKRFLDIQGPIGGGTVTASFKRMFALSQGFNGQVAVSVTRLADFTQYACIAGDVHAHRAGGSGWQSRVALRNAFTTQASGAFSLDIAGPTSSPGVAISLDSPSGDANLDVLVTFGSGWTGATFRVDVTFSGGGAVSV